MDQSVTVLTSKLKAVQVSVTHRWKYPEGSHNFTFMFMFKTSSSQREMEIV